MTRRKIREIIFKILFRVEFTTPEGMEEQIEYVKKELEDKYLAPLNEMGDPDDSDEEVVKEEKDDTADKWEQYEKQIDYIVSKSRDIVAHLEEIDEKISTASSGWKLDRLGKAELAILRLGVYEMLFEDSMPVRVAINEAVELTKKYCDEDAKGFVNAVLGKIEKNA